MRGRRTAELLLRVALAFSFFYAAVSSFFNPTSWLGFFPSWILALFSPALSSLQVLYAFSALEVALGLWLLSGLYLVSAGVLSAVLLVGVVAFNIGAMEIVFRDLSLAIASLALVSLVADKER